MAKTTKYIIIAVIVLGVAAMFLFTDKLSISSLIAGGAGVIAAIKSRLFQSEPLAERLANIEQEHATKRSNWDKVKEEYDSKFNAIKARMDYLDYRSARISEQISNLDEVERKALEANSNLTDAEILDRLNNI